jgi:hypothetical protein
MDLPSVDPFTTTGVAASINDSHEACLFHHVVHRSAQGRAVQFPQPSEQNAVEVDQFGFDAWLDTRRIHGVGSLTPQPVRAGNPMMTHSEGFGKAASRPFRAGKWPQMTGQVSDLHRLRLRNSQ